MSNDRSPAAPPDAGAIGRLDSTAGLPQVHLDAADVRAIARLLAIELTDDECAVVGPALSRYLQCGALLEHSTDTDLLPSDDPRWFDA